MCPEHIKITDTALIPMKERVVGRKYDPLVWLGDKIGRRTHKDTPPGGFGGAGSPPKSKGGLGGDRPPGLRQRETRAEGLRGPATMTGGRADVLPLHLPRAA